MYRKGPQGWLKHLDFTVLNLVALHRNGMAFFLSKCGVNGQDHLTGGIQSVDVFLFKKDSHRRCQLFQLSCAVEGIHGIPCESRYGFCDY